MSSFMTALIISDVDLTNLKQYFLSKYFKLSRITVHKSSLVNGAFW